MTLLTKDNQESQKSLSKIVAKTWLDEEFKSQLLSNTNTVLEENGLVLPSGVEFQVRENTIVGTLDNAADSQQEQIVYEFPMPAKPAGLSDQQIQSWVSGNNPDSTVAIGICFCGDGLCC